MKKDVYKNNCNKKHKIVLFTIFFLFLIVLVFFGNSYLINEGGNNLVQSVKISDYQNNIYQYSNLNSNTDIFEEIESTEDELYNTDNLIIKKDTGTIKVDDARTLNIFELVKINDTDNPSEYIFFNTDGVMSINKDIVSVRLTKTDNSAYLNTLILSANSYGKTRIHISVRYKAKNYLFSYDIQANGVFTYNKDNPYFIYSTQKIDLTAIRLVLANEYDIPQLQQIENSIISQQYLQTYVEEINAWVNVKQEDVPFIQSIKTEQGDNGREYLYISTTPFTENDDQEKRLRVLVEFEVSTYISSTLKICIEFKPINKRLASQNGSLEIDINYGQKLESDDDIDIKTDDANNLIVPLAFLLKYEEFLKSVNPEILYVLPLDNDNGKYVAIKFDNSQLVIEPLLSTNSNSKIDIPILIQTDEGVKVVTFALGISGISTKLSQEDILLIVHISLGVLAILVLLILFLVLYANTRKKNQRKVLVQKNMLFIKMKQDLSAEPKLTKDEYVNAKSIISDPDYMPYLRKQLQEMQKENIKKIRPYKQKARLNLFDRLRQKKNSTTKLEPIKKPETDFNNLRVPTSGMELEQFKINIEIKTGDLTEYQEQEFRNMHNEEFPVTNANYNSNLSREDIENQILARVDKEDD